MRVAKLLSDLEFGVMAGYSPTPIIQTKSKGMGRNTLSGIMRIGETAEGEVEVNKTTAGYPMIIATHSHQ